MISVQEDGELSYPQTPAGDQIIQMPEYLSRNISENPFLDDFFTIFYIFPMIFMLPTTKNEWKSENHKPQPTDGKPQTLIHDNPGPRKSHPNTQTLAANHENHNKKPKPWPQTLKIVPKNQNPKP